MLTIRSESYMEHLEERLMATSCFHISFLGSFWRGFSSPEFRPGISFRRTRNIFRKVIWNILKSALWPLLDATFLFSILSGEASHLRNSGPTPPSSTEIDSTWSVLEEMEAYYLSSRTVLKCEQLLRDISWSYRTGHLSSIENVVWLKEIK